MKTEEVIEVLENNIGCAECGAYYACHGEEGTVADKSTCKVYTALKQAVKALKLLDTVTDGSFHDLRSPRVDYKIGWNDALEAVKLMYESEDEENE